MAMDPTRLANAIVDGLEAIGVVFTDANQREKTLESMQVIAEAIVEEVETYYEPPP